MRYGRKTKIRKIGGSLRVILPKAASDGFEVREYDNVYVVATPDGILITPYDPDGGIHSFSWVLS